MKPACTAVTIWPEVPPNGVRLACSLPSGHDGDHACADIEYLPEQPTIPTTTTRSNA